MSLERCPTCQRPPSQSEWFECSHIDCPNRKPVAAQPCDGLRHDAQLNLTSHRPVTTGDEEPR